VIGDLRQRLRPRADPTVSEQTGASELETASAAAAAASDVSDDAATLVAGVEVEFAAYAEDCRLFGFYRLHHDRLSDALNDASDYELVDVMVVRLGDGVGSQAKQFVVSRDELLAVRAAGPRGDPARRARRRPSPVTIQTGPYRIHGYIHGTPGADPLQDIRRRRPMVPLTESWIEYESLGAMHRARTGTIIVNRFLMDSIRIAHDDEIRLPNLPAEASPDARAKDLTGYIWSDAE
jgi:hypothetical protein